MEPYRDDELSTALAALRPTPRPSFAAELDARVAAGFPRQSSLGNSFAPALDRLRALKPRQILLPVGATALTALLIATVVISQNGQSDEQIGLRSPSEVHGAAAPSAADSAGRGGAHPEPSGAGSAEPVYEAESPEAEEVIEESVHAGAAKEASPDSILRSSSSSAEAGYAAGTTKRAVERSSELTLGTEPENVGKASGEVFDVVHTYRGIVLRSRTSDGSAGAASAEFELLIPSAKLGDAMAAFSEIAEVRSRHEATTDITAPTVGAAEHLEDSRARIDSLLAQLAAAETESEREAVEAELRGERNRAAALSSQLQSLERRANLSRVSLRIESDEAGTPPSAGSSWGIGDALHDAGQILAVAAAVTLVGVAILAPFALIALLAWLAHRAWVRRGRRQALT